MYVYFAHQTDPLQGIFQNQYIGFIGVVRAGRLWHQLVLLGNLPQDAGFQLLMLEQRSDDDALFGVVLLQFGQLLDRMFVS